MSKSWSALARRLVAGIFIAAVSIAAALPGRAAETIVAGGTGSGSRLLQLLADEYGKTAGGAAVRVADPPLGSGAAIKAVRDGKLHLAISGRPLEGDERNWELMEVELARTPFVLAGRDGAQPGGFKLGQLEEIYDGRRGRWDDGKPIRLVLRPKVDADNRILRAMSPGMDKALAHAMEHKGMVVADSDMEALEIIEQTPGSLGPTTLGLIRLQGSPVQVFPLAGRAPSVTALADGSYPWFKPLYLVTRRQTSPDLQAFLDFLKSPRAGEFMTRTEHLPAAHGR